MTIILELSSLEAGGNRTRIFQGAQHGDVAVSFFLVDADPGEGPGLHVHPYAEVFVVQEGAATFTVGAQTVEIPGGHVVVAPAGVPHRFVNTGAARLRTLNIHPVSQIVTEWIE